MTLDAVPPGAHCGAHPDLPAAWTCLRCGSFFCTGCERRTRPEARPMCPGCWELRTRSVGLPVPATPSGPVLPNLALGIGILALVPSCYLAQIAGIVLAIVALATGRTGPARAQRGRAIAGLVLSCVGFAISAVLLARAAMG